MSKFVVVNKMPTVGKAEVVITAPDFSAQVAAARRGSDVKRDLTTVNKLREILLGIQEAFNVSLNVYKIPLSKYEGINADSDGAYTEVVTQLLKNERPDVFEKILEYNIKNRPFGTKLIYYVGALQDTTPFFRNGIDMIEEKDIDEFLGRKTKKVVGKPAVSKEQSEESVD